MKPMAWSRRRFLQVAGGAPLLAGSRFGWAASLFAAAPRFAYVGLEQAIQVYALGSPDRFVLKQEIASARPVAMAIRGGHVYVANGVSLYDNLPRGSVEAYEIDAASGHLVWKDRQPLSLSAIAPNDLAVAPEGNSLVVAVQGGGAYNVLPIQKNGRLGRVSGIMKEIGSGPDPSQGAARPSAVLFCGAGRVLAADQGTDLLSALALHDGELSLLGRRKVTAGSGPASMVMHPNGRRLFVAHTLQGSISSFAYDTEQGLIGENEQMIRTSESVTALALHPSGETLYSAHKDGLRTWAIRPNGELKPLPGIGAMQAHKLYLIEDGSTLLALTSDAVLSLRVDRAAGMLSRSVQVVATANPLSIAVA